MHPIVIADEATFQDFENGKTVTVYPLMTHSYLEQIERDRMRLEVWEHANTRPNRHHIGKVLSINGKLETIPEGAPQALSMTIQKA